ncbi:glycosyltransferase family 2 protein [Bernardetia sp. OM2101]|uniref:glycosyltransferase family 2 protein n=1 Tax=Bernardetia sp. OM2101 TaxID=3344876 RepID=UPI0035D0DCF3
MMLSPVILFVYKRSNHTKQVLEALSLCQKSKDTPLIIYSDGAKTNSSSKDKEEIEQTRTILREFKAQKETHFLSIEIYESESNKGLAKSVKEGITEQINKYEKVIVLEDDIVPQKGFLKYMNEALEKYEKEDKVWGISAYAYPLENETSINQETFFLPINSSWGWATWKTTWNKINFDIESIFRKFEEKSITAKEYNFGSYYYYQILEAQREQKIDSWAVFLMATMFLEKGCFLFPKYSLSKNIGFDVTGTHCSEEDLFFNSPVIDFLELKTIPITIENEGRKEVEKTLKKQFGKPSFFKRIQNKLDPNSPYFITKRLKSILNKK